MSDLDRIRKFEYRPSRRKADFTVEFIAGDEKFCGKCSDISDAGIRAEFDGLTVVGKCGVLILRHPAGVLHVEARVAYSEKNHVALVFIFKTPLEREIAVEFIAAIVNDPAVFWPR